MDRDCDVMGKSANNIIGLLLLVPWPLKLLYGNGCPSLNYPTPGKVHPGPQ